MKGMNEFLLHAIGLDVPYAQLHHLIRYWGGMEVVNEMKLSELAAAPGVHPKLAGKLSNISLAESVQRGLERADKAGWFWTSWSQENFPHRLKECEDAPLMLFYKGKPSWNVEAALAVVGTRKAQSAACDWVDLQLKHFKAADTPLIVLSGLAYGIDIAAHRSCLKYGIPTFAVLAHGPDELYPRYHQKEAEAIQELGALITEFFPCTPPVPRNFLQRNRIVAGMCDATWVVASSQKGGALVTADIAFSYQRTVWANPGAVWDDAMFGCNDLIRRQKANFAMEAKDIAFGMNWKWQDKSTAQLALRFDDLKGESLNEKKIHALLKAHGCLTLDELGWTLQIPLSELLTTLLQMELSGWIQSLPGARYQARTGG